MIAFNASQSMSFLCWDVDDWFIVIATLSCWGTAKDDTLIIGMTDWVHRPYCIDHTVYLLWFYIYLDEITNEKIFMSLGCCVSIDVLCFVLLFEWWYWYWYVFRHDVIVSCVIGIIMALYRWNHKKSVLFYKDFIEWIGST